MSIHGVLGESTSYPKTYSPDVLYAISRSLGREAIYDGTADAGKFDVSVGVDWWHAFEVSWLNAQGVSQVAIARFSIPADSPKIVESKSLKLYLNSLNFTEFPCWQAVEETITQDVSACVGAKATVQLFQPDLLNSNAEADAGFLIDQPEGYCLDNELEGTSTKIAVTPHPDASLLVSDGWNENTNHAQNNKLQEESYQFYSNLLRSNCPVTNQPDWGTIAVAMTTQVPVKRENLLRYILSFRMHNGFHEQCVEQIFADISQYFTPSKLMVRAWYTRRGGIDINPCRVSELSLLPKPSRLIRQ